MKKLGTRITEEHKEKLLELCDREDLHQGEMIEKLIDFYLDNSDKPNGMASLRGTEFDVKVNDGVQTVSKLYVFPNFPSPQKCRKDREITPSKNSANSRRKKGTGSGYIYWRTIRKNGSEYKQTWYYYELKDKNNRRVKSSEYIPKKLRSKIE